MDTINAKIYSIENLKRKIAPLKIFQKKIVFTNGCFDILHLGHIDYLSKAAQKGDFLIIGVNSDASVQNLKGKTRPIQDEISRTTLLASLQFVDAVIVFNEDTPFELIKAIEPTILVKGADYKIEDIVGADIVLASGGKVETIDYLVGYSTSAIEKNILTANKSVTL